MASPEQDYATAASRILESLGAGQAAAALQAGQIQAEAQRQRGQIWGQALSQIGGQIGNLPMQIAQQKEAAQKQQFGAIQLEQAKAAQAGQTSANALIASLPKTSDGLFDTGSLQQQLAAKNVPLSIAEPLLSSADKMNAIHRQTVQDKLDRYADVADVVLSAHKPGDPITPDALDMGFELAKHIGLTTDAEKPAFLQSMAQAGVDPESALKGIRRLSKKYADQEKPTFAPRESPGYMQGGQFHQIEPAKGTPKNATELAFDAADPKSPTAGQSKAALELEQGPTQARLAIEQANSDRAAAAQTETARHNRVDEGIARQRIGNEDVAVNLTPQGLDVAAENFAKTGQLPPMGMGKQGAAVRTKIINRAAELHPTLDLAANRADYKANTVSLDALQKQGDAVTAFEKTAGKNLQQFLDQAKKVIDTGSPWINTPLRALNKNLIGNADQPAYEAARQVALTEIAKITSNPSLAGQLSDSARKEIQNIVPEGATTKQLYAVAKILVNDMQNRRNSIDEQIGAIKGRIGGKTGPTATHRFNPATGKIEAIP